MQNYRGITLISLVVTVVILMLLVGVSVSNISSSDDSVFKTAKELENETNEVLSKYDVEINTVTNEIQSSFNFFKNQNVIDYIDPSGANEPAYIKGMTPVTINENGDVVNVTRKDEWYNYANKIWANAKTEDGSLWVWIPRFAYKLDKGEKKIDILFLKGTSNKYLKDGKVINIPEGYIVHPSFISAKNGDFSGGELDREISGYWVAKFEAGFQQGDAVNISNNDKNLVVRSNVNYTAGVAKLAKNENNGVEGFNTTRNYIDGIYGENISGNLEDLDGYMAREVKISYPVFKGANYAMNYISINDAYMLCKSLANEGNIYGINEKTAAPHLMKNSEWGAVAYLSYSKYGTDGEKIYRNNISLNSSVSSVYGVTGYVGDSNDAEWTLQFSNVKIWNSAGGKNGSSNKNYTGIYDLSGGLVEMVSSYVDSEAINTSNFGFNIFKDSTNTEQERISNKNITVYKIGTVNNSFNNYNANSDIKGDAISETSLVTTNENLTWYYGPNEFPYGKFQFFTRGGGYRMQLSDIFIYSPSEGYPVYDVGFRAVIYSVAGL